MIKKGKWLIQCFEYDWQGMYRMTGYLGFCDSKESAEEVARVYRENSGDTTEIIYIVDRNPS